jgi:hypothetical protein
MSPYRQQLSRLILAGVVACGVLGLTSAVNATSSRPVSAVTLSVLLRDVSAATKVNVLPKNLQPSLSKASSYNGIDEAEYMKCYPAPQTSTVLSCDTGDTKDSRRD